ncbi:MAG TPA: lysylphosphatidylglycerol synthase transmembrane domain-containing protein [Gammaproteobacteria bacterium]
MSGTARSLLRAGLAVTVLAWLAQRVGVTEIMDQLAAADLRLVLAATVLLALDGVSKAWNWRQFLIVNVGGQRVPFRRALTWFFAGGLIGAVVPSSAGTDACRALLATRGVGGYAPACAASIVTLNALGWFAGCVMGLIGLALLAAHGSLPRVLGSLAVVFLATLAVLPLAYAALAARCGAVATLIERSSARWPRVRRLIATFLRSLLVFQQGRVRLSGALLIAALGLLAQTAMFAVTALAVGIHQPFAVWMVLVPLTRIVALAPVTVADFGLIQAAHVAVLELFGVLPWQAFALSTLFAIEGLLIHSTLGSSTFLLGARGRSLPPAAQLDSAERT